MFKIILPKYFYLLFFSIPLLVGLAGWGLQTMVLHHLAMDNIYFYATQWTYTIYQETGTLPENWEELEKRAGYIPSGIEKIEINFELFQKINQDEDISQEKIWTFRFQEDPKILLVTPPYIEEIYSRYLHKKRSSISFKNHSRNGSGVLEKCQ